MPRTANRNWNPNLPEMPVDENGNWIDWAGYSHARWETVHQPFPASFEIDGMRTGRSSKKVILKDVETGRLYPMFVSDLVKGVQQGDFELSYENGAGRLSGLWTGSKRGANYGIKAVRP